MHNKHIIKMIVVSNETPIKYLTAGDPILTHDNNDTCNIYVNIFSSNYDECTFQLKRVM